ncbi:AIF_collapsed_G0056740.mRNA.1.CDS.1 [Saccharomyces cerevisiae]|nr:AIF_collapsed_G0056740.mRNA.1.CDS.1 [Saccharomyces cerevisiae]
MTQEIHTLTINHLCYPQDLLKGKRISRVLICQYRHCPSIATRSVSSPTKIHSEQLASPAASVTYTTTSNNLDELTESKSQQLTNDAIQKNDRVYSSITSSAYTTGTPYFQQPKEVKTRLWVSLQHLKKKLDDFTQLLDSSFGEEDLVNTDSKDPLSIKSTINESLPPTSSASNFFLTYF